jgi:hypothetical protein
MIMNILSVSVTSANTFYPAVVSVVFPCQHLQVPETSHFTQLSSV